MSLPQTPVLSHSPSERLFLRRTGVHVALGVTLGLAGALAAGALLQAFLVQTSARDPLTLTLVVLLLIVVAGVACLVPARRAARLDPVSALRQD